MRRLHLVALLILAVCGAASAAASYSYVDLVNKLTDLEGLSVLPQPGETCKQWSSYDRASYYDEKSGKYVGWDANGDNNGMIRKEGDAWVMAEMEGPGCIWRIWSALAGQGHVKIYLDGATEPTIDLPFIGYFDGQNKPFTYKALVHNTSRGFNNYVPIPYQKSCKIVAEKDWGAYYQFVYTTYPEGTIVPTFKRELSPEEIAALEKADRFLRMRLGSDPAGCRPGGITENRRVEILPGQSVKVAELTGPRAITQIWFWPESLAIGKDGKILRTAKLDPADPKGILRNTSIRIRWDGEREPSVWSPIGDFFGTGPGMNEYKSLPLGVTDGGMYAYWYMPFATSAVIELVNESKETFRGRMSITHAPVTKPVESLGRFHAKWHRDAFLPTEPERWIDWPMLKTQGRGRFVGVQLEVWNPRGGWWGEGDEKFFVDGEKFPSTIGTGSEDYFGYAWCNPGLFQNAYHNQTRNDGDNVGHVSVNRWQIADNIPFQRSFEGCIEKYFPNNRPTLYASTVYWYLDPDGVDPYKPVPVKDRTFYVQPKVAKKPGAIEGEEMKVTNKTGGGISRQDLTPFLGGSWSGDAHLWWTNAKPGDRLELEVPVEKSGKYDFKVAMTKAADYGIVQFYLDGRKLGDPIDLYNNGVIPTGEVSLGTMDLTKGTHKLMVEIVGANEKAIKAYMFGLDYVKLVKK